MLQYLNRMIVLALLPLSVLAAAEGDAEAKVDMLPLVSADVRQGVLPNGLRYLIKPNAEPAAKVEMRLLVNVGSLSEADDERGLAHLRLLSNRHQQRFRRPKRILKCQTILRLGCLDKLSQRYR